MSRQFAIHVPGKPVPMPRPRVTKFGVYHPKTAVEAKARVVEAWERVGSPQIGGCIGVELFLFVKRPPSHFTKAGALSAAGRSQEQPRGDVDNYLKLVLDALNGKAWRDDVQVVSANVHKVWAPDDVLAFRATRVQSPRASGDMPFPESGVGWAAYWPAERTAA